MHAYFIDGGRARPRLKIPDRAVPGTARAREPRAPAICLPAGVPLVIIRQPETLSNNARPGPLVSGDLIEEARGNGYKLLSK